MTAEHRTPKTAFSCPKCEKDITKEIKIAIGWALAKHFMEAHTT